MAMGWIWSQIKKAMGYGNRQTSSDVTSNSISHNDVVS